jgi:hypothetical protein
VNGTVDKHQGFCCYVSTEATDIQDKYFTNNNNKSPEVHKTYGSNFIFIESTILVRGIVPHQKDGTIEIIQFDMCLVIIPHILVQLQIMMDDGTVFMTMQICNSFCYL